MTIDTNIKRLKGEVDTEQARREKIDNDSDEVSDSETDSDTDTDIWYSDEMEQMHGQDSQDAAQMSITDKVAVRNDLLHCYTVSLLQPAFCMNGIGLIGRNAMHIRQ